MTSLRPSYRCPTCGFDLWIPLATLSVSTLGLYNDSRFPGRCILVLNDHFEELAHLADDLLSSFARDIKRAGRAIEASTDASRMNYAVLGNTVPHVHCHIIPRFKGPDDPNPTRPIWESPLHNESLPEDQVTLISDAIVEHLKDTFIDK